MALNKFVQSLVTPTSVHLQMCMVSYTHTLTSEFYWNTRTKMSSSKSFQRGLLQAA